MFKILNKACVPVAPGTELLVAKKRFDKVYKPKGEK